MRKDAELNHRVAARSTFHNDVSVLEQRSAKEAERRAKFKSNYIGSGVDMLSQINIR
jgi:hypothetical protein